MVMMGDTKYYGIWIQKEDGHYWICDANGGDQYFGTIAPTEQQVMEYRNKVVN